MTPPPLTERELALVRGIFRLHPEVTSATLFGSRAKGTHSERSDVDLVVTGEVAPPGPRQSLRNWMNYPLPYRFDVQPLGHIHYPPLLEHIKRVGILIYPAV